MKLFIALVIITKMMPPIVTQYIENIKAIKSYALTITNDINTAEDLVQDLFIRLASKGHYTEQGKFGAYARRAAKNLYMDYCQKKKRDGSILMDSFQIAGIEIEDEITPQYDYDRVEEIAASLPMMYKQVYYLRYKIRLTCKEIAKITGQNLNTVTSQIKRLKEILTKKTKDHEAGC